MIFIEPSDHNDSTCSTSCASMGGVKMITNKPFLAYLFLVKSVFKKGLHIVVKIYNLYLSCINDFH